MKAELLDYELVKLNQVPENFSKQARIYLQNMKIGDFIIWRHEKLYIFQISCDQWKQNVDRPLQNYDSKLCIHYTLQVQIPVPKKLKL